MGETMAAPSDEIYEIHWEGPFDWKKRKEVLAKRRKHMIYAIYGIHCVYGPNTLLYIGYTERAGTKRLDEHNWWVEDEADPVSFRLGSIRRFNTWENRKAAASSISMRLVKEIETLLIYGHQPAYNSRELQGPSEFHAIRVFNSGNSGILLPELSYRYYIDPD
jgi:hypothetical protein